jgi:hypothetical protein
MRRERSRSALRPHARGTCPPVVLAAAAAVVLGLIPAALAGPAGASGHKRSSGPCLSAAKLSAAVGATWSGLTVTAGLSPGQKLCNYMSSSTGATFLISHEALDGSTVKALAHDSFSGTRFVSATVERDRGLKGGHPGFDILLVQKGSQVYEFLDNSDRADTAQLESVAKLVLP